MIQKIISVSLLIVYMMPCCSMIFETTDQVSSLQMPWNCEIYNKGSHVIKVFIGNKVKNKKLVMEYLASILPTRKARVMIDRSVPLAVEIQTGNRKLAEAFVMPCLPRQPCAKTVFLTLDYQGLRPQTGQWYGLKGITDSELDITNNIEHEELLHNWSSFVTRNRHLFQDKVYASQQGQKQEPLMYEKAKETVTELWHGKPLSQQALINEIAKYKNFITEEADRWITIANNNQEPSFKKETALAILNKWKRESVINLDHAQSIDDIKAIQTNFQNRIARTKQEIQLATEKTKFKNQILHRADSLIADANKIESPLFKKATALGIINKWKRQSVVDLDQAQTIEDIEKIKANFDSKTENTRQAIEDAKK